MRCGNAFAGIIYRVGFDVGLPSEESLGFQYVDVLHGLYVSIGTEKDVLSKRGLRDEQNKGVTSSRNPQKKDPNQNIRNLHLIQEMTCANNIYIIYKEK